VRVDDRASALRDARAHESRGDKTAGIGHATPGDIERGPVIRRGTRKGQPEGHVHGAAERGHFDGGHPDVVVRCDHDIELAAQCADEDRVRRERAGDPRAPAEAMLAIGAFGAIGFSPFAIDSVAGGESAGPLGRTYRLLDSIAPLVLAAQREGRIAGFAPPVSADGRVDETSPSFVLGDYRFTISFVDPWTPRSDQNIGEHGGLIVRTGPEDYLVAGEGVTITFAPADPKAGAAGIDRDELGHFEDGGWRAERRLNGDETHQGRHVRLPPGPPTLQSFRLYTYR